MSDASEDRELCVRAQDGDRRAFEALVARHHARLIGLCAALLGGSADAEDAAQEVFLKAYRSLGSFRGGSSFYTWLYRIASNHCLDRLRASRRRPAESWEGLLERDGDRVERLLGAGRDPDRAREDADLAARVLALLPEDYRLALLLRETQGFTYDEIASAMDCSLDSVKARLRRARGALREGLRHFPGAGGV